MQIKTDKRDCPLNKYYMIINYYQGMTDTIQTINPIEGVVEGATLNDFYAPPFHNTVVYQFDTEIERNEYLNKYLLSHKLMR